MRFYSFFLFLFSNFWFILALFFSAASHVFYSIWRVYQCTYIFKRKKNSVTLLCYIQCLFNIFCEDTSSMDTFVTESRREEEAEIL